MITSHTFNLAVLIPASVVSGPSDFGRMVSFHAIHVSCMVLTQEKLTLGYHQRETNIHFTDLYPLANCFRPLRSATVVTGLQSTTTGTDIEGLAFSGL